MQEIKLGNRPIGLSHPALIIGEVAQAHDGSLNMAHAFIDAIADAGADAVKFQTHIAAAESTPLEKFRVPMGEQDETRLDYWRRMEFSEMQWANLADHARQRDLLFLSSPFSLEAVELLEKMDILAWKVASGEITHEPMLSRMAKSNIPFILSSGMSDWGELDHAVSLIRRLGASLAILQCTTAYPTGPSEVGLNVMLEMRKRYDSPVGLSDHSGTFFPSLAAVTLGANIIEVHITLSRQIAGPDVDASITPQELGELVKGARFIESALSTPVDKDAIALKKADLRAMFFHSVVVVENLDKGTVLERKHLATKKPGTGIPTNRLSELVGRQLARAVKTDHLLTEEDLV